MSNNSLPLLDTSCPEIHGQTIDEILRLAEQRSHQMQSMPPVSLMASQPEIIIAPRKRKRKNDSVIQPLHSGTQHLMLNSGAGSVEACSINDLNTKSNALSYLPDPRKYQECKGCL